MVLARALWPRSGRKASKMNNVLHIHWGYLEPPNQNLLSLVQSFAIAVLVQFLAQIISIDRQVVKTTKTNSGNYTYILHCVKAHHATKFTKYFWTPFIMASTTKYKNKFCVIDLYFPILYQSQYIWTQVYTDIYNHHHLDDFPPPKFWGASLLSDLLAAAWLYLCLLHGFWDKLWFSHFCKVSLKNHQSIAYDFHH